MDSWGADRTIRATLIRQLLTTRTAEGPDQGVRLLGAVIDGHLDLADLHELTLDLSNCRITSLRASTTTFTDKGGFYWATFTEGAWFAGATFNGNAAFDGATFNGNAVFVGTTFNGTAGFYRATFTDYAGFNGATFTDHAGFDGATFTGDAAFNGATFNSDAWFDGATFNGNAAFDGAVADTYNFRGVQFQTADPGPWVARKIILDGAIFQARSRVAIAAAVLADCRRLQAREGVHFLVQGGAVDLTDAEFLRRSILEHPTPNPSIPHRDDPGERPEDFDQLTSAEQARWTAQKEAFQHAQMVVRELEPDRAVIPRVTSLRRATAGDLVLSGINLKDCAFAGAHGLDKLRINATCSFGRPPAWLRRPWPPFIRRQVIAEERLWRPSHTRWWRMASSSTATPVEEPAPTALEIAGIYRDLRKGLEDSKDEPGAGDFYYGEMEMRRLAARRDRRQPAEPRWRVATWKDRWRRADDDEIATVRRPSWVERRLLDAYWAISGYGLRAGRAVTALTILLIGCAALFTLPAFAHVPAIPQHVSSVDLQTGNLRYALGAQSGVKPDTSTAVPFGTSLEFTSTEGLTLIHASGTPLLETTGAGTVLNMALRLLAPLLLGLALLAVRGRTKR